MEIPRGLVNAVACSRKFAVKVLKSIKEGSEHKLFDKNIRYDAIKASKWPQLIADFVELSQARNKYTCP